MDVRSLHVGGVINVGNGRREDGVAVRRTGKRIPSGINLPRVVESSNRVSKRYDRAIGRARRRSVVGPHRRKIVGKSVGRPDRHFAAARRIPGKAEARSKMYQVVVRVLLFGNAWISR